MDDEKNHACNLLLYEVAFALSPGSGMSVTLTHPGWLSWEEVRQLTNWLLLRVVDNDSHDFSAD